MAAKKSAMKVRVQLMFMVAVIVVPWLSAWWAYQHGGLSGHAAGKLIQPPWLLSQWQPQEHHDHVSLQQQWWLWVVRDHCEAPVCQQQLQQISRLHLALAGDAHRMSRALTLLAPSAESSLDQHRGADWHRWQIEQHDFKRVNKGLGINDVDFSAGVIYLVDPRGRVMMQYPSSVEKSSLLKDIKRLMKASHIG